LIPIQPAGTQTPIFCIHGGAGTILHLADLARRLGSDQPFYGLQSRGLYGGVPPLHTVEEMAQHYLREMRDVHPAGRPWRLAGYCFGTIVAFEIAQELLAKGEQVEMVAMFNGPSPAWIKRWGWYGNQPSWRERHGVAGPALNEDERRARRRRRKLDRAVEALKRIPGALRHPRRILGGIAWYTRKPRTRILLALGRPVPEHLREEYFFDLHQKAERLYEPTVYPGDLIIFYGEGLYEDPALGWDGLAAAGITSYGVPGEHEDNRHAMHEPAVEFVAQRLEEYLAAVGSGAGDAVATDGRS
jgi:aspartate racemase